VGAGRLADKDLDEEEGVVSGCRIISALMRRELAAL